MMKRLELRVPYRQEIRMVEKEAIHFEGNGYGRFDTATDTYNLPFEVIIIARAENKGYIYEGNLAAGIFRLHIFADGFQVGNLNERNIFPIDGRWHTYRLSHDPYTGVIEFQRDNIIISEQIEPGYAGFFMGITIGRNLIGDIDYLEIRRNHLPVLTYPINEGSGSILHNMQGDSYRNFLIVNGTWVNGKPYPPRLYQPFELEVEP